MNDTTFLFFKEVKLAFDEAWITVKAFLNNDEKPLYSEQKRNKIKAATGEKPRLKPSKVLVEIRAGTKDETYVLMGTDRALEEVMRKGRFTATWIVSTPAVFRKWREMGLAELYANDEEQGEGERNSFRKLLALALIPEQHVRRGFALIVNHAPDGLAAFFGYFARVYVGLTAHEQEAGALAFAPGADQSRRSSISTNATGDEQLIGDALDEAEYNTDEDVIINILSLLSLQMQGYVGGLRARGAQREHEDRE
ncbi:hypothetical protein niasHT_025650 [Heterodera trifolii]|uniref:Uncharacterized protein n=1 Tax=Heterodera trifolii TaxID=157864 RepID=A0ABD2KHR2_9BILA